MDATETKSDFVRPAAAAGGAPVSRDVSDKAVPGRVTAIKAEDRPEHARMALVQAMRTRGKGLHRRSAFSTTMNIATRQLFCSRADGAGGVVVTLKRSPRPQPKSPGAVHGGAPQKEVSHVYARVLRRDRDSKLPRFVMYDGGGAKDGRLLAQWERVPVRGSSSRTTWCLQAFNREGDGGWVWDSEPWHSRYKLCSVLPRSCKNTLFDGVLELTRSPRDLFTVAFNPDFITDLVAFAFLTTVCQ